MASKAHEHRRWQGTKVLPVGGTRSILGPPPPPAAFFFFSFLSLLPLFLFLLSLSFLSPFSPSRHADAVRPTDP
ncbi:hypothetical protein OSH32_16585, partial [Mycobacterium ulcerans]